MFARCVLRVSSRTRAESPFMVTRSDLRLPTFLQFAKSAEPQKDQYERKLSSLLPAFRKIWRPRSVARDPGRLDCRLSTGDCLRVSREMDSLHLSQFLHHGRVRTGFRIHDGTVAQVCKSAQRNHCFADRL